MSELLNCRYLTKKYGNVLALDNVNITLDSGKIVGLLGPNGSGKTTLIKILNGLLTPTAGQVFIDGKQPGTETKKVVAYLNPDELKTTWVGNKGLYRTRMIVEDDGERLNTALSELIKLIENN